MRHKCNNLVKVDNYKFTANINDNNYKNYQNTPLAMLLSTRIRMIYLSFKGYNIRRFIQIQYINFVMH